MNKSTFIGFAALLAACSNPSNTETATEMAVVETETNTSNRPEKSLIEPFEAIQNGGTYTIVVNAEGSWKLYRGESHHKMNWTNSLAEVSEPGKLEVDNSTSNRDYFAAVSATDTVWFSNRHFVLDGPVNFRDLGGLVNENGKTVVWGKVFRSDNISGLTETDLAVLTELGVGVDIDFRQAYEIAQDPDALPNDGSIEYVNLPMGDTSQGGGMAKFMQALQEVKGDSQKMEQIILGFYSQIPLAFANEYKEYFRILDEEEGGVLYHCSAGKDRTGIASALLLYTLGVNREDIKREYALSNYYRFEANQHAAEKMAQYGITPEVAPILMGVKPEYMDAIFAAIEKEYGSVDAYLETALGVDSEMKARLKAKYLL